MSATGTRTWPSMSSGSCRSPAFLAHEGVHLGLEFIGPKTLRDSQKYPFVHTMAQMLGMAQQIGPNVGLLLDCWHWHTSHGTVDELHNLTAEQVVYVHVNDAPAGVPTDEQVDSVRALPGETGVIDIVGFLQALQTHRLRRPGDGGTLLESPARPCRPMPSACKPSPPPWTLSSTKPE